MLYPGQRADSTSICSYLARRLNKWELLVLLHLNSLNSLQVPFVSYLMDLSAFGKGWHQILSVLTAKDLIVSGKLLGLDGTSQINGTFAVSSKIPRLTHYIPSKTLAKLMGVT